MSLGTFLESLCLLRMIVVARLTVHKPKMPTENAATDRKLFVWRFPLTFLREIWLLTYMGIRWNVARVSMRRWRDRCTCTWWRSWSRCASECGRWWRSGRGGGTWDCRKNSERPKRRFAAWKSFGRICHRFGRIWIGRVRASGTFEDNSIYFESAEECLPARAVFSGMLTGVVKFFETSPHPVGEGGAGLFTNTLYYKPHPTPQLTKNFGKVGANVENYFSSSAWQLFSSWKPVQKLSYTVNFFTPDSLVTHHLCVCQLPRRYRFIQEKCQNDLLFILPPFPFRK